MIRLVQAFMLVDPDPSTNMADLLSTLATVVTQVLTWVTAVASTIVSTPILLLTTGFLCLGGAIGIFGRLLSKN